MKYLLLIYEDDAERVEKMDERMPHCAAYVEAMKKAGIYQLGERLRAVSSTTSVRVANGRTHVVDGPYVEAKEQLGGFMLLEAKDLNHAIQLMSCVPCMQVGGSVEIRPINEAISADISLPAVGATSCRPSSPESSQRDVDFSRAYSTPE